MVNTNTAIAYRAYDNPSLPSDAPSLDAFLFEALQVARLEIELAKVAMRRSANGEVKQFVRQLLLDYSVLERELAGIATRSKRAAFSPLEPASVDELVRLAALRGPEFDMAYVSRLFSTHDETVATFKSAAQLQDPTVSAVARTALIQLQGQRRAAEPMLAAVQANAVAYRDSRRRHSI